MLNVVLDTNVLVSALISPEGAPAKILALVLNGRINPCYDSRILSEYETVLRRPKFPFSSQEVAGLLQVIVQNGLSLVAAPRLEVFIDEADKKFYEVAKSGRATLITGNRRHFPDNDTVISPADFLELINQ